MNESFTQAASPARPASPSFDASVPSPELVALRPADIVAISAPFLFGLALLSNADRVGGWLGAVGALFGVAVFGLLARVWATRSDHPVAKAVGNFYFIASFWVMHARLNPLIDMLSPVPYDRDLQAIDQWIFGMQPSVWMERFHHPWLTEILFVCYFSFFFWQLGLGIVLVAKDQRTYDNYILMLAVFYVTSYIMYVCVPAVGPRFDLVAEYNVPLEGVWLTDTIRRILGTSPMLRDCFPSGHTGLTLLVLWYAYRAKARRFFVIMLPFAMLLILSTVYCRFHYVVDLLCALPFITAVVLLCGALRAALPEGLAIPLPRRTRRARTA